LRQELSASKEVTMVLKGHLKDVSKTDLAILRNQLRKISCDQSIEIVQIEEGSIVLKLTGTDEGFKVIKDLWETGKLTTLIGLSIEAVDYEVLSPDDHGEDSVSVPIVNTERVSLSDSQYPEGSANFFFDRCVVNQSNQISVAESVTQASAQSAGIYMSESENYVNNLQGATIANMANAIKDNGRQQANQHVHPEHQKTLVEAFWDIQQLLKKLEQDEPEASDSRKITYVNDETSPSFKHRAASALLAGGETAIEELLDNPYLNIGKAIIKGWIKPG
jgi:hypothetical protein